MVSLRLLLPLLLLGGMAGGVSTLARGPTGTAGTGAAAQEITTGGSPTGVEQKPQGRMSGDTRDTDERPQGLTVGSTMMATEGPQTITTARSTAKTTERPQTTAQRTEGTVRAQTSTGGGGAQTQISTESTTRESQEKTEITITKPTTTATKTTPLPERQESTTARNFVTIATAAPPTSPRITAATKLSAQITALSATSKSPTNVQFREKVSGGGVDTYSQLPAVIAYLLQERRSLVAGLATLTEKVDNLTSSLASQSPPRDRQAEGHHRTETLLLNRLNLLNLSVSAEENRLLLRENRQLRAKIERAEEELRRAERENAELSKRLARTSRATNQNTTTSVQENEDAKFENIELSSPHASRSNDNYNNDNNNNSSGSENRKTEPSTPLVQNSRPNHLNSTSNLEPWKASGTPDPERIEALRREVEEEREINRKIGEEKARLEGKLTEMEEVNRRGEENRTRLENENVEKERIIREMVEEKREIEGKNRLMAERLQECKRNISTMGRRHTTPRDCAEVYCSGVRRDGVYSISPFSRSGRLLTVWCDMTSHGGGWTLLLRRQREWQHEDFRRDWAGYRRGFGMAWGEHWLGLEPLHHLTGSRPHHLRLSVTNLAGEKREALWNTFAVGSERTGYELQVGEYDRAHSTLGDSLVTHHNLSGQRFSTKDRDNDNLAGGECVQEFSHGGGWWYHRCSFLSPTGPHAGSGKHMISLWTPGNFTWISVDGLDLMFRPASFPAC